jgi:hypothetical protein
MVQKLFGGADNTFLDCVGGSERIDGDIGPGVKKISAGARRLLKLS